jgi:hypothetical protein
MATHFSYTAESPLGQLHSQTSAALAEGLIPPGCPHPAAANRLRLHEHALLCADCEKATFADPGPGECDACGAPGGSQWLNWLDIPVRVVVAARVCPRCLRTGNRSMAAN